jgi:predicted nucleotide-binding protein (sugar kinase/HSP70/actin superfamily)
VAIDYDPGASEVNQLNRIKLMLASAKKNLELQELECSTAKTSDESEEMFFGHGKKLGAQI